MVMRTLVPKVPILFLFFFFFLLFFLLLEQLPGLQPLFFWSHVLLVQSSELQHHTSGTPRYRQTGLELPQLDSREERGDLHSPSRRRPKQVPTRGYTVPGCPCVRFGLDIVGPGQMRTQARARGFPAHSSTCSHYSSQRGRGQRVVSYSYYNPDPTTTLAPASKHLRKYLRQLQGLAIVIRKLYPGWVMRIYHNVSTDDVEASRFLCRIFCVHTHVDLCDVTSLPGLGDLVRQEVVGRLWRFSVLGDPTVDAFLVRDSDSWVLDREVAAVEEWIRSGQGFHVMRDHPNHHAVMLAGLWGGFNRWPARLRRVRDAMFSRTLNLSRHFDQYLLATHLWPIIKNDVLQHDSYTCLRRGHEGSRPFPVRRVDDLYCGSGPFKVMERHKVAITPCPEQCRPAHQPGWTFC